MKPWPAHILQRAMQHQTHVNLVEADRVYSFPLQILISLEETGRYGIKKKRLYLPEIEPLLSSPSLCQRKNMEKKE
jgi:hypothetical protein